MEIDDLNLTVRSTNLLIHLNIKTIDQLLQISANDLMSHKMFGRKSLDEIRKKLALNRLSLKDDYIIVDAESIGDLFKLKKDIESFLSR